jgi:hypothetical protein
VLLVSVLGAVLLLLVLPWIPTPYYAEPHSQTEKQLSYSMMLEIDVQLAGKCAVAEWKFSCGFCPPLGLALALHDGNFFGHLTTGF